MLTMILADGTAIAAAMSYGVFGSPLKIFVAMVFSAAWLFVAPKLNNDAIEVHINRQAWSGVYLASGVLGLVLWFVIPIYLIGLLLFLILACGSLIVYVAYRNTKVEPVDRLFTAEWFADRRERGGKKAEQISTQLRLYDSDGRAVILTESEAADSKTVRRYNLTQSLLYELARRRVSEADIRPAGEAAQVRCIVDGVISQMPPMTQGDADAIIQYLKEKGGMEAAERRRPQKGKVAVDLAGSPIDMELLTAGTSTGQRLQIRVMQEIIHSNIDLLGMDPQTVQKLLNLVTGGSPGLLLISGPGKSGVTSTLYSLVKRQDAYMKMLVTVEARSAMDVENVTQNQYGEVNNLPATLATVIRHDPDVILLDQCPDANTAQIVCQFAAGKFIMLGLRARDSFTALAKWAMVVGNASQSVAPIRGVLCQTLLRKICPVCREPYHPDPSLLAKINMPASQVDVFYRPPTQKPTDEKGNIVPCQTCQDSGYYGRTGVFEFLEITDELRELISRKASLTQIRAAARKNQMLSLRENAMAKVIAGETSIQEVLRAFQQDSGKK